MSLQSLPVIESSMQVATAASDDKRRAMAEHGPTAVNVYLTMRCNLECSFCLLQKGGVERSPDVSVPILKALFERYPTIKSATIAGFGEPLVSTNLWECASFLRKQVSYLSLITNGILVNRFLSDIVNAKFDYINVSVNAATEEDYVKLVEPKPGDFQSVLKGVRALKARRQTVHTSFVAARHNHTRIPDFLALGNSLGADTVVLHNLLPANTDRYHTTEGFWDMVLLDEHTEVLAAIEGYKKIPSRARVLWPIPISRHSCPNLCDSPFVTIGVDGRGCISGCRRVEPPSRHLGTIEQGYHTDYWQEARRGLLGEVPLDDKCRMCFGNWRGD